LCVVGVTGGAWVSCLLRGGVGRGCWRGARGLGGGVLAGSRGRLGMVGGWGLVSGGSRVELRSSVTLGDQRGVVDRDAG
jgi:hypothetical protein